MDKISPNDLSRFGGKAVGLSRLVKYGLPVPKGFAVDTRLFAEWKESGAISHSVVGELLRAIMGLGGAVAIRSSATIEDGARATMAGLFETRYVTVSLTADALHDLLVSLFKQADSAEVRHSASLYHNHDNADIRLALVIQRLITDPIFAGVVYATATSPQLIVQYVHGYGAELVDGRSSGTALLVDRAAAEIRQSLNFDQRPMGDQVLRQITTVTNRILRRFGGDRDIEFAVDRSSQMWVLQDRVLPDGFKYHDLKPTIYDLVRQSRDHAAMVMHTEMAALGTSKSVLTQGNFAELLPRPTAMDEGVFAYIFTGYRGRAGAIQIGRRQMGYQLGKASVGYMHRIGGRTYESLARDAATYYSGFPETEAEYLVTMVNRYLDLVYEDPSLASYPEMGLYLQNPTRADLAEIFGDTRAGRLMVRHRRMKRRMERLARSFTTAVERRLQHSARFAGRKSGEPLDRYRPRRILRSYQEILEHLRRRSCVDFVIAARLGFYFTQRLRELLTEDYGTDAVEVVSRLCQGLAGSSITDSDLAIADAPTEQAALEVARAHVYHFPAGGEILQLRHPRLSETPDQVVGYVRGIRAGGDYRLKFEHQRVERAELERTVVDGWPAGGRSELEFTMRCMQRYMVLREVLKDQFTKEYLLLRQRLVVLAAKMGLPDQDIFHLYPDELATLVARPSSIAHLGRARAREFSLFDRLVMPRVLRPDNLHEITQMTGEQDALTEAVGQVISPGTPVAGVIVNLEEFTDDGDLVRLWSVISKLRAKGTPIIVAAQQVNLTHDQYINVSEGLILQNAGFVSHGAQRARELGVGAISGIDVHRLHTGTAVHFDPTEGRVVVEPGRGPLADLGRSGVS